MSDLYTSMGNVETNKIEKPQNNTSISLLDDNNTSYQEVETEIMDLSSPQEQLIDTEQYDIYIKDLENTKKELEAELQAENNEITPDEVSINQQISTYKANLTTLVVRYTQSEDLTKRDLGMSREDFIKLSPEEQESLVATKTEEGKSYKQNIETLESQLEKSNTKNENISQLEGNIALLNTAINSLKHQKEALPYQQMLTTEEYQKYESKSEVSNDISKYATNYDIRTNIDYERYCEENGNISPLELLKGLKEQNPTIPLPQSMTGVENIGELKQLLELEEVNPEMVKLYNYIYDTEGKDAANKYLDIIKPQLNQMQGQKQAQEYLNSLEKDENGNYNQADVLNHLKTSGKGLGDGVENFFQGFANLFNSTGELSVNDYETIYIMQALEENGGLLSNNYELSQSIGNVAPSIIISMLATPMVGTVAGVSAAGTIGSTIGTVSMGLSSGGNAYAGALSQGYSTPQAIMYGVLTGSTEAVTQKLLGGLPGLNDVAITGVKTYLQASAREGFQEGVQSVMDSYFRSVLFGEEIDLDQLIDEVGTSAVYGAITAGIFNSPNLTLHYTNKSIQKLKGVDGFDQTALGTGLGLSAVEIDNLVNNQKTDHVSPTTSEQRPEIYVPPGVFEAPRDYEFYDISSLRENIIKNRSAADAANRFIQNQMNTSLRYGAADAANRFFQNQMNTSLRYDAAGTANRFFQNQMSTPLNYNMPAEITTDNQAVNRTEQKRVNPMVDGYEQNYFDVLAYMITESSDPEGAARNVRQLQHQGFSSMGVIHYEYIPDNTETSIYINSDVIESVYGDVVQKTMETQKEYPFVLYGKRNGEKIEITKGYVGEAGENAAVDYASATKHIQTVLRNKSPENQNINVVILGHTHPTRQNMNRGISVGDLSGYVTWNDSNSLIPKMKEISGRTVEGFASVLAVPVTSSVEQKIDFNFIKVAPEKIEKYTNVYDASNNSRLPAYRLPSI